MTLLNYLALVLFFAAAVAVPISIPFAVGLAGGCVVCTVIRELARARSSRAQRSAAESTSTRPREPRLPG
jgi:hypothetical protein